MKEKEITISFLKAISETFEAYNEFGARSNKKLNTKFINGLLNI